jgi:LAS superfamily LD-carboxypeptidase LdcB
MVRQRRRARVAPPGRSFHGKGQAVDLRYGDQAAREWAHQHAAEYGLNFPLGNEPWHIEPIGIRNATMQASRQVTSPQQAVDAAPMQPASALPPPANPMSQYMQSVRSRQHQ